METKVNEYILFIPPYISTSWNYVTVLRRKQNNLYITVNNGDTVEIPELSEEKLDLIFKYHSIFLEKNKKPFKNSSLDLHPSSEILPFPSSPSAATLSFAVGSMDGLNSVLQHNIEQASAPDLPEEILNKITEFTKFIPQNNLRIPKAEPHCNCFYCQIARVLNHNIDEADEDKESCFEEHFKEISKTPSQNFEEIERLSLSHWVVSEVSSQHKIYQVTSRLNQTQNYSVCLGEDFGCTCGEKNCVHVLAVLKS